MNRDLQPEREKPFEIAEQCGIERTVNWRGSKDIWVEMLEKGLYPPEQMVEDVLIKEMLDRENFKEKTVLDAGCGTGRCGAYAQDKGAKVVGIDLNDEMLGCSARKIPVFKMDITQLAFPDNSFDVVFSWMVLMVVPDYQKAISEVGRVLKPGGKWFWSIIHPQSEKWDEETGLCYKDSSNYNQEKERLWVLHLIDGREVRETYFHRSLEQYKNALDAEFSIQREIEPLLAAEFLKSKKYAQKEYYLCEAMKKS